MSEDEHVLTFPAPKPLMNQMADTVLELTVNLYREGKSVHEITRILNESEFACYNTFHESIVTIMLRTEGVLDE